VTMSGNMWLQGTEIRSVPAQTEACFADKPSVWGHQRTQTTCIAVSPVFIPFFQSRSRVGIAQNETQRYACVMTLTGRQKCDRRTLCPLTTTDVLSAGNVSTYIWCLQFFNDTVFAVVRHLVANLSNSVSGV
jgi:hypothetical protein